MPLSDRTRRLIRRTAALLAMFAGLWAAWVIASGGGAVRVAGVLIRSRDPVRPLIVAVLAAVAFFAAGGRVSQRRLIGATRSGTRSLSSWMPSPGVAAVILAAIVTAAAVIYGAKAVGGADEYGYMSQADRWLHGPVREDLHLTEEPGWPSWPDTLQPLGYRMLDHDGTWAVVPVYPPGLPFLLAVAKLAGGESAAYYVVPFFAGLLVLATYGIGRRLASPSAGLAAAWLIATSPVALYMMMPVMSDTPAAALIALAFYFALGTSNAGAVAGGLCFGLAALMRPNLVPLGVLLVLPIVFSLFDPSTRGRGLRRALLFAIAPVAAGAVFAAVNASVYGSVFASSYGDAGALFGSAHIRPNLHTYIDWFIESETPVALLGLLALVLPIRWLWPKTDRRLVLVAAALVGLLWLLYLPYLVFDGWWFLRMLLPIWPFIMVGLGAVSAAFLRAPRRLVRVAVMAGLVVLGAVRVGYARDHSAFDLWRGARRYAIAGSLVAKVTPPGSVILSMQHSGSLRYYGGRMTLRYEFSGGGIVDPMVAWFTARHEQVYLLAEDWELPMVRNALEGSETVKLLDRRPVALFRDPGEILLFDLSQPPTGDVTPYVMTGVQWSLTVAEPVPQPHWSFVR